MDVHPCQNGIYRYWSMAKLWKSWNNWLFSMCRMDYKMVLQFLCFFFCPLFFWIHMMDYNKSPIYFGLYNTQSSTDRDIEHSSRIIKHFIRVGCIFCDIAKGPTVSCLWIWTIAITVVSICHVFMFFPQWLSYLVANYPRLVSGL